MNKTKLLFVLYLTFSCSFQAQVIQNSSSSDLIKQFQSNYKSSLVSNDIIIEDLINILSGSNYEDRDKLTVINLLLTHYFEKGEYLEFDHLFIKKRVFLKQDPLISYYWENIFYNSKRNFEKGLYSARMHLKQANENGNNDDLSNSYMLLAKSNAYLNKKDSALYFSNLALNFAKRSDSEDAVSKSFKTQSEVYNHFGMIGRSTSVLIKLIDEAEKNKDYRLVCWGTIQIAHKSMQIRYYNEAKTYFRKALSIAEKHNAKFYSSIIYRGLAETAIALKEVNQAEDYLKHCFRLIEEWKESTNLPLTMLTKSKLLMIQKDYTSANSQLSTALNQFKHLECDYGIGITYHLLGKLSYQQNEWTKAEDYFQESKHILNDNPFDPYRIENHKYLALLFAEQNNFYEAYLNLEEYHGYSDINSSISSSKAINELTQMYSRELREYRIKEQEQVITNQEKEKELLALKSDKQLSTIISIVIVLISIIIIVVFYFRQLKIKQQRQEVEMSQTLLRTQMNPHFIFNAMSVIQSYIYENDPNKSSKFLVSFSKLIRLILENSPKEFIPLDTEIDILDKYLKTQKMRFENRFDFKIIAPEELIFKKILIPPMITQPFVENSIEHGQLNIVENGHIEIEFEQRNNMLFVKIQDNGIGRRESRKKSQKKDHKSMALDITAERVNILNKKYKSKATVSINDLTDEKFSGTLVELYLPLMNENINFD